METEPRSHFQLETDDDSRIMSPTMTGWFDGEYEVGVGRIIGVVKRVLPDLTRHDRTLDLSVHNIFFIHHIDDNYARWTHVLVVLQIDIGLITSFLWRHQECTSPGNQPVMDQ